MVVAVTFVAVLIQTCQVAQAAAAPQELVQWGAYLARAGDCLACHTAPEERPFTGGVPFELLVGRVYSTNITPDLETGIGGYNRDDFVKSMHEGVAKDGHYLYPAMPYTSYARASQEDLSALYAYFMQGLEPVHNPNRPAQLKWPLGIRSLMVAWNALYFNKGEYVNDPQKNTSWNRGASLVQGLGHCGACHTPRGAIGEEKASSEQDGGQYLAGATLNNWYASPLTGDPETGLHAWSKDEIAEYLKSLPPADNEGQDHANVAIKASDVSETTWALRVGDTRMAGSGVYLDNCNACHRSDGSGANRTFPNLVKNEAINAGDPISLIHIVLAGSAMPSTQTAPSAIAMPDFGWRLSDEEVADVLNFVRGSWGNHAAAFSQDAVERLRKSLTLQKSPK